MADRRDAAIDRMNAVIDNLKQDFLSELDRQLVLLREDAPTLHSGDLDRRTAGLDRLKRLVHEMRGMAETFGFPLLNQAATSTYHALHLDFEGSGRAKALACFDTHVHAIGLLAQREREGICADEEKILVQSLEQTVAHLKGE